MIQDPDGLLAARFAATVDSGDDGDWAAVVARAGRARRQRRVVGFAGVAAVVVVGAASAFVFGRPTINFLSASKGPYSAVANFGSMQVGAPPGMSAGVLPHETRRITAVTVDGKTHVLYVAPTKAGGFCEEWTSFDGGCRSTRTTRLGVSGSLRQIDHSGAFSVTIIDGSFFQTDGARLMITFADGTEAQVPFVWVTAPIDAGFYLYRIPDAHRTVGHEPVSVSLYDAHNHLLAVTAIKIPTILPDVTYHLEGFPPLRAPANVIWSKRQMLFDILVGKGRRYYLWVAPERGGGTCFASNHESGCSQPAGAAQKPQPGHSHISPATSGISFLGLADGNPLSLCCFVGKNVAHVELRFQDGARIELTPKHRYLLAVLSPSHYLPGHRLNEIIAYNPAGKIIATRRISTSEAGVYPCTKPKNVGYGVTECP